MAGSPQPKKSEWLPPLSDGRFEPPRRTPSEKGSSSRADGGFVGSTPGMGRTRTDSEGRESRPDSVQRLAPGTQKSQYVVRPAITTPHHNTSSVRIQSL
jgi:hypothetical protein